MLQPKDINFMIKALPKVNIKGTYLNIKKAIMTNAQVVSYSTVKKIKAFPLRSKTGQGCPLLLVLFNIVLEVQDTAIREETQIKGIQIGKK